MRKRLYIALGILNVALGTAGILLPLLPTTPFLLLAAFLFARSSDRLYHWLLKHKYLGPYIHAFRNRTGLTRTQKIRIGASFSVFLGISLYFAPLTEVRFLVIGVWLFWMAMLARLKTTSPLEP